MGGPQINVMQLMAAGQADCTLGDNGQALETWQAGVHAVTVATVFQHSPTVFITHYSSGRTRRNLKTNLPARHRGLYLLAVGEKRAGSGWQQSAPHTFNVQPSRR